MRINLGVSAGHSESEAFTSEFNWMTSSVFVVCYCSNLEGPGQPELTSSKLRLIKRLQDKIQTNQDFLTLKKQESSYFKVRCH